MVLRKDSDSELISLFTAMSFDWSQGCLINKVTHTEYITHSRPLINPNPIFNPSFLWFSVNNFSIIYFPNLFPILSSAAHSPWKGSHFSCIQILFKSPPGTSIPCLLPKFSGRSPDNRAQRLEHSLYSGYPGYSYRTRILLFYRAFSEKTFQQYLYQIATLECDGWNKSISSARDPT